MILHVMAYRYKKGLMRNDSALAGTFFPGDFPAPLQQSRQDWMWIQPASSPAFSMNVEDARRKEDTLPQRLTISRPRSFPMTGVEIASEAMRTGERKFPMMAAVIPARIIAGE